MVRRILAMISLWARRAPALVLTNPVFMSLRTNPRRGVARSRRHSALALALILVLLVAVQPAAGDEQILYTVDLETPEFLAIYNQFTRDIDIYALEHPNRTVAAGAASIADYHVAVDAGAYDYLATTRGLAWRPLETAHAPDGMVDVLIVASQGPGDDVTNFLIKLINETLKTQGCGVDPAVHPTMLDGNVQNLSNWWAFEGTRPNSKEGWDGFLEYCETTT